MIVEDVEHQDTCTVCESETDEVYLKAFQTKQQQLTKQSTRRSSRTEQENPLKKSQSLLKRLLTYVCLTINPIKKVNWLLRVSKYINTSYDRKTFVE